jgi:hypothetical protein
MTAGIQNKARRRQLEIQAALPDWHRMNTATRWARLIVTDDLVVIEHGVIHDNGFEECALGSIVYVVKEDWVVTVPMTHGG